MTTLEENQKFEAEYTGISTLDAIHEMKKLQEKKEAIEESLSELNKRYDYVRLKVIPLAFDNEGITNMRVEGIGRVQLTGDAYVSIRPGRKEEAYQWLSDNGHGDSIQPSINPSTLKAMMKSILMNGEDIPESLFSVIPFVRASITKA